MTILSAAETARAYAEYLQPYFRRLSDHKMRSRNELDDFIERFLSSGIESSFFRHFNSALDAFLNLQLDGNQNLGPILSGRILSECLGEALTKNILHNFSAPDAVALAGAAAQCAGITLANDSLVFQENVFRRLLALYIASKSSSRGILGAGDLLILPYENGQLPKLPSVRCSRAFVPVSSSEQENRVSSSLSEAVMLRRIFANVSGRYLSRNPDGSLTVVSQNDEFGNVYLSTTLAGLLHEIKPRSLCISRNWGNSDIFNAEAVSVLKEQQIAVLFPVEYTPRPLPYIELMFSDLGSAASLVQKLGCCRLRCLGSAADCLVIFGQCK